MPRHCADRHVATSAPEFTSAWTIVHSTRSDRIALCATLIHAGITTESRSILHDREGIKEKRGCACHGAAPPFSHIPIATYRNAPRSFILGLGVRVHLISNRRRVLENVQSTTLAQY